MGQGGTKDIRVVPRYRAGPGQHGAHDRGRGQQGGYREAPEGLRAGRPGNRHPLPDRCLAGGLRDGGCGPAVGDPCVPEEVEDRDQDAEGRDRSDREPARATEKGDDVMSESDFELVEGSGNVFRDHGDPDADLKQAKAILAARIIAVLDERGLSVRKAGALTRFAAADFSRIRNADLGRFTLDRLMKMLAALDSDLRVTLHVDARHRGEVALAK